MSMWPLHASDACEFLLYEPMDDNNVNEMRELRNWGIEWDECVDAFLATMKTAGFPVSTVLQV